MKLTKLIFENYRAFNNRIEIKDLDQINYFIGQNSVGKSNIQQSFEIFHKIFVDKWNPNLSDYYAMDDKSTLSLGFEIHLEKKDVTDLTKHYQHKLNELETGRLESLTDGIEIRYRVEFVQRKKINEMLELVDTSKISHVLYEMAYTKGTYNQQSNSIETLIMNISKSSQSQPSHQTSSSEISASMLQAWPELAEQLQHFFSIEYMRNTRKVTDTQNSEACSTIPTNGTNFANYHQTIVLRDDDRISRYQKNISKLSNGNIKKVKAPLKERHVSLQIQESTLPKELEFSQLSSGRKELIMFPNLEELQSNIACVEEPEMHQHANSQRQILEMIKSVAKQKPHTQFFIESHSPIFTGSGNSESTFLIAKTKDGVSNAIKITGTNMNIIRQELGISYADVFDHDYFLFVEGASEHKAFEIIAKALKYNTDRNIKCWNLDGNGNAKNLKLLLTYIERSERKIFLILDNDNGTETMVKQLLKNGLIKESMLHVLKKSFEDTFTSEQIIEAVSKICKEKNAKCSLTLKKLEESRTNERVDKILDHTFGNIIYKPKLAQELAAQITEENCDDNEFAMTVKDILQNKFKFVHP